MLIHIDRLIIISNEMQVNIKTRQMGQKRQVGRGEADLLIAIGAARCPSSPFPCHEDTVPHRVKPEGFAELYGQIFHASTLPVERGV